MIGVRGVGLPAGGGSGSQPVEQRLEVALAQRPVISLEELQLSSARGRLARLGIRQRSLGVMG